MLQPTIRLGDQIPALSGPVTDARSPLERLWDIALGNLADSSKRTYRARLKSFARWNGIEVAVLPLFIMGSQPADFHANVQAFREHLKKSAFKAATRNLVLAALSRMVAELHAQRLIDWTLSVRGFKGRRNSDTAGPSEEIVRELLERTRASSECLIRGARDEAIIRLAVSLGLRRSEIVSICLEDVVDEGGTQMRIAIHEKGGDDPNELDVPRHTASAVRAWLAHRRGFSSPPAIEGPSREPLFIRLTHAAKKQRRALRLTDEGVAHLLDRLRRLAGIEQKVRPHGLRHRAITSLLESGATLSDAVAFARHSDPKTTLVYWDNHQQAAAKAAQKLDRLFAE